MSDKKMSEAEAELIALRYICGWAGLNIALTEDFYRQIPLTYLVEKREPNTRYGEYDCTEDEAKMIQKYFSRETDKLIRRMRKIKTKHNIQD